MADGLGDWPSGGPSRSVASIGLGLTLIVMVYLGKAPPAAFFSLGLSALALGVVQLLGLAKAERVVVDALLLLY